MSRAREMLLAEAVNAAANETVEDFTDNETKQGAKIARSGYGKLPVYKLTPTGSVRTVVAVQSIHEVLSHPDYAAECHDCGRNDCRSDRDINACEGRPPRQYRVCPVNACSKRVYDPKPTGKFKLDEFDHSGRDMDDPNIIQDDSYTKADAASRTKSAMDLHIIGYHPATAMEMGIGRPQELPRLAVVS